ncbi:MAG: dimethylsulfoniopropionate demethylase, partial [Rhodobacteraceae bacterium]|nr:dimethylsulfoniopropionate demethylase [Paracoccaceae bacterium]
DVDYIGKSALLKIAESGVRQKIIGVLFDGDPCPVVELPFN